MKNKSKLSLLVRTVTTYARNYIFYTTGTDAAIGDDDVSYGGAGNDSEWRLAA